MTTYTIASPNADTAAEYHGQQVTTAVTTMTAHAGPLTAGLLYAHVLGMALQCRICMPDIHNSLNLLDWFVAFQDAPTHLTTLALPSKIKTSSTTQGTWHKG